MWTKEDTEELLLMYQQWPILYDPKNKDYLNRKKRNNALENVRNELKKNKPDISIPEIKNKIKTLRSQFGKERNKEKYSKKSGVGTDDVYEPTLWCYDQLKFLYPNDCDVVGESNMSLSSNDSIKSLPKRRKVIEEKEEIADVVCDAFEESGNDITVLAQGWSSQYTELSRQQKVFARKIISDVLFHGCLDNLRESTVREIHNMLEAVADKLYDPLHSDE